MTIEKGIGEKFGALLQSGAMCISGLGLAFFKGWSLALPMCLLGPIIAIGLKQLVKGMTQKFIRQSAAFAKCAAFSEGAMGAIRIVVAFGMEKLELENYGRILESY